MPESRIDDLNPEQLRAAIAGEGPVLTIAGAGTGKTKTLAARVAWLVSLGVAGMVATGLWCERVLGMEVVKIGRSANGPEDCALEVNGRELFVRITLQGTWIWIFATGMDEGEPPQFLFNVGDGPAGWVTVRRFVAALERSGIKSLRQRPVELGTPGSPDAWVIG